MIETTKETVQSIIQGGVVKPLPVKRETFVELTGIQKLEDVGRLSRSQLIELCDNFPQASAELIIDLLSKVVSVPVDPMDMTKKVANG